MAELAGEAPVNVGRGRANATFVAVLLGMLLAALDQTIVVHGAAHHRRRPRRRGAPVVGGDRLPARQTIMTALVGKFGDLFGRKQMFLAACSSSWRGSFFCGFAG